MGINFEIFIVVLVVSAFGLFSYMSINDSNKKEDCSKKCGIYKSLIIDEICYCNSMPQSWLQVGK